MSSRKEKYALDPKPVGIGGQAEVYKARDKGSGDIVALKRVLNKLPDTIARMRREIEVQTSISHPNVMPILDSSASYTWYTMPLATKVLGKMQPPISDDIIFSIVNDCALGLSFAHTLGYIHRDLTPDNIFLLKDNDKERWVVSDWGLVRTHGKTTEVRTQQGQEFGTMGFAAPELWTNAHDADVRADIYSLGRVVVWCITGQSPTPNIPIVPSGRWKEFIEISTNLDPSRRFKDMDSIIRFFGNMREKLHRVTDSNIETQDIRKISGLNLQDSLVFKTVCDLSLAKGSDWIGLEDVQNILVGKYMSGDDFLESIELLADEYFISGEKTLDGLIHLFKITANGFESYSASYLPDFEGFINLVLVTIVQNEITDNQSISSHLNKAITLVDYALDILESRGMLSISKTIGGTSYIDNVTVRGRRAARSI